MVTGASSGIGAATARRLDAIGWRVFGGVRRAEDAEALRRGASERLTPVLLDVTDEATIRAAVATVREAPDGDGLDALVNNAGMAAAGPQEHLPVADLRRVLEVNLVGAFATTQAFLPLLRARTGRIVQVSSLAAFYGAPLHGPYSASKAALERLTDALRRELAPWGIRVALIEAGPVRTPIWERAVAASRTSFDRLSPDAQARYRPVFDAALARAEYDAAHAVPVERAVRAIEKALTAKRPRIRTYVGKGARASALFLRLAPDRLVDWVARRRDGVR